MPAHRVDVETFIRNVESEFDGGVRLQATTRFRDLADWTSLQALIVIAGFERDYGVTISGDDVDRAQTVQDLYDLVIERADP